jgi:hypothetical protein
MTIRQLNLGETEFAALIEILKREEEQMMAWVKAKHTTEPERRECLLQASICQMAYLQLEGAQYAPPVGQPDWSTDKKIPYRIKGGITEIES